VSYAREIAHIEIEDTGPGIDPKEYDKIFEPFERGSAANQINIGGTGLGLTISKLLTELMGGEINFKSELGKGTKFDIRLFLSEIRRDIEIEPTIQSKRVAYSGKRRKVLVVDNEQVDRELVINILAPLGFDVAEAATGQECLEVYKKFQPDVILMDLAMPVMDGWEASYIIRKIHHSDIPIAIVSANAYDKNLENAAGIDSRDFMVKPVNLEDLLDWLGNRLSIKWIMESDHEFATQIEHMLPFIEAEKTVFPETHHIQEILSLVSRGYVKGLHQKLDEIIKLDLRYEEFVKPIRQMVNQFKLEAVKTYIEDIKR
jgi:CheY-like chemotaxis protein